jgi:hypothetical protein
VTWLRIVHQCFLALLLGMYFGSALYASWQELSRHDEKVVYAALLNQAVQSGVSDIRLTIASVTNWDGLRTADAADIRSRLPDATDLVISDYLQANEIQAAIDLAAGGLRPEVRFTIAPSQVLTAIFMDPRNPIEAWEIYHLRFPDSPMILSFSRVGFDKSAGQALFYYSTLCGPLCGTGNIVLMRLEAGQWTTAAHVRLWIS